MRKQFIFLLLFSVLGLIAFQIKPVKHTAKAIVASVRTTNHINEDSLTIQSRVNIPEGYKRVPYAEGSFQDYLRNYKLKPFGSKIINYDDTEYFWQGGHIGVLEIPVPKNGLQQCADALIRVRSEYPMGQQQKRRNWLQFY